MRASTSDCAEPPRLSAYLVVSLHLGPGAVFFGFLYVLSGVFVRHGLTGYLAELIAIPACLAPMLIGIVFLWSRRAGEGRSLIRAITYRERGAAVDYIVWPFLLYAAWALSSLVTVPLAQALETQVAGWFPPQLSTRALMSGVVGSPAAQRHATFVLAIVFSGVLAPVVEEAYFRGFLLPRMRHWSWLAPVASSFLFGLYHFISPWSLPVIFVAFLPVVFVVQATKNFRIGIVVHAMFNITGVLNVFLQRG